MSEIVLVAPYKKMLADANRIIEEMGFKNVSAVLGDLSDGLIAASRAVDDGAKVLISRGGTYSMIHYVSPVPVVEIRISAIDMADMIKELQSVSDVIAVVGYANIMSGYELLSQFGKKIIKAELCDKDDVAKKIRECGQKGAHVIVGDAVTCRIGQELGFTCYLLESGERALLNAINEAQRMLAAVNREQELADKYRTLTDSVHDGVLATDEHNIIVAVNRPACRIFGLSQLEMLGKPLSAYRTYGAIIEQIEKGIAFSDEIKQIGVTKIVASNSPIVQSGAFRGSITVFQDVTEVQTREKNIRLKMIDKGFVAKYSFNTIVYKSKKIADCIAIAKKISNYNSAVLIEGQSGVGKELFAQSIHNESQRRYAPFVAVNCAALPPALIESVLFGYAEGAFTGSSKGGKEGMFELAHTGTLFLDEIGELPLELQGRLLRVVQEHEVMRIGGDAIIPLDVRLICATNRNLHGLVREGKFRRDLLYRINTLSLYIPSLNERPDDIELLSKRFLARYCSQYAKDIQGFTPETITWLQEHKYEGNVRELQSLIERAVIICDNPQITLRDLSLGLSETYDSYDDDTDDVSKSSGDSISMESHGSSFLSLKDAEQAYIQQVYEQSGKSVAKTCAVLGINRSTLWRKLK
ncbi:MAG: sigma 54-interacting transcriptional regulator [Treponema sp.]|nr:sigma 54-interacting transcriptional regulator [Treponema sp.]